MYFVNYPICVKSLIIHVLHSQVKSIFMPPKGRHIVMALRSILSVLLSVHIVNRAYILYFFEVRIPNFVCGCVLGRRSDAYHFWVTVTSPLASVLEKSCLEYISYIFYKVVLQFEFLQLCQFLYIKAYILYVE